MPDHHNDSNIIILGNKNDAHIEIIALPGIERPATFQDGINVVADPRTIWRSVESLWNLIAADEQLPFKGLHLSPMTGYFGWPGGNPEEDETITPVAVFLYFPPELIAEEALKRIEIWLQGELSPSLAVGLLSIAPFFDHHDDNVMNGLAIGFVHIAGRLPAHGISYLSDQSIRERARKFIFGLENEAESIELNMPDSPVDRAKYMISLADACWQTNSRRQIARSIDRFSVIAPLMLVVVGWLYLNPDKSVEVSGETIVSIKNFGGEINPWLQCLEWDAHDILPKHLRFFLRPENRFGEQFKFLFSNDYPFEINLVAGELSRIILDNAYKKTVYIPDFFRVVMPKTGFYKDSGIHALRICGDVKSGFWIGIEPSSESISASFFWRPQAEMPISWITGSMDLQMRAIIHLTLVCLWRDLTNLLGEEFLLLGQTHYSGIDAYSWGQEEEIHRIQEETQQIITNAEVHFGRASAVEEAQAIINLANNAFSVRPKALGRVCLELFLHASYPSVVEF